MRALDQLGVRSGHTLLINGASGSVGSAAVQFAVARGARVIGTAAPANHDYVRSLGADPVAYGEGLTDRVRALTSSGAAPGLASSGAAPALVSSGVDPALASSGVDPVLAPTGVDPALASSGVDLALASSGVDPVLASSGVDPALASSGIDLALDVAGSGILPELIALTGGPDQVLTVADFTGAQTHGVRFSRGGSGRALHALTEIGPLVESGRFRLPPVRTFPLAEIAEAHRLSESGQIRGKLVLLIS